MCGIVGIWNYRSGAPVDRPLLAEMTDCLRHRGPDDSGMFFDDGAGIALGFRRLSIIDLSPAGHQPMADPDRATTIIFNGEIYNFQELRQSLEGRGYRFRSRTDTETLLYGYAERGVEFVRELNGMFGIGLWDSKARRLMLARDRLGKKPVYYYDDGNRIVFASELKAILRDPSVPRHLDGDAVAEYLSLGYITGERSIVAGVHKLPPASLLVHQSGQATVSSYWDWLPALRPDPAGEAEWTERLRGALQEAVACRLTSDVPLGAFLSGGIDSSAVVAMMARSLAGPVKTFSIGFADEAFSELPFAREVAQHFGTDHHEYVVEPEAIEEILPRLVHYFDEPFGDPSALPTYYVAKIARQDVTVTLSGDGGDELFGGYGRYGHALDRLWIDRIPRSLRAVGGRGLTAILPTHLRGHRQAQRLRLSSDERYAAYLEIFSAADARRVLTPQFAEAVQPLPPTIIRQLGRACQHDLLTRMQYVDLTTYLPDDILVKVDRASMANSLEARSPLLDYRLVELAGAIPSNLRWHNGQGKYLLKQAMRDILPDRVIDRPKMGFGIPGQRWIRDDSSQFVADVLLDRRTIERGVFEPSALRAFLARNQQPGADLWARIWLLLIFELWARAYLDSSA